VGGKFNFRYLYINKKLFIDMEQDKKLKNFIKTTIRGFLNEQYEHTDDGSSTFYSSWVNEKDYDKRKNVFVWDVKEYLTGFFGTVGLKNEKQIMKRLEVIFDYAMSKPNEHGINFLRDDYEFRPQIHTIAKYLNTDDVDMVYGIIDGLFNQE
jgi:hypothetical protein